MNTLRRLPFIHSDTKLFAVYFVIPLAVGLLVQLVLLPYVFPQWHAGNGLLKDGDWIRFHERAVTLSERIHAEGWGTWELAPYGTASVGIAAVFYTVLVPQPWVLLPLNAALHAGAALVLFHILRLFVEDRAMAFAGSLPLFLFPSAMMWYTQIHKDGYFIFGFLLFLYAALRLLRAKKISTAWLASLAIALAGVFLIWLVRAYALQVLWAAFPLAALFYIPARVFQQEPGGARRSSLLTVVVAFGLLLTVLALPAFVELGMSNIEFREQDVAGGGEEAVSNANWQSSGWPTFIENRASALADYRDDFISAQDDTASGVDTSIHFQNIGDIVRYAPRALELVFLAPFPSDWFGLGSVPQTTVMRRISALEMTGIYAALLLLLLALFHWRRKLEVFLLLLLCVGPMLAYGLVVANIGTLYRFRYGFLMTLVGVAIAGSLDFFAARASAAPLEAIPTRREA